MAAQSTLRGKADPLAQLLSKYIDLIRARWKSVPRTYRLIALVAFTVSLVSTSYGTLKWWQRSRKEEKQGRHLLRRNSGIRGKDGSRTIYVPYKKSTARVTIYPTKNTTFDAHRRLFLEPPRRAGLSDGSVPQVPPPQTKPGLNLAFLHQFMSLLVIMIPRWGSKETGLLFSHGVFLLLRTYLSLVVARLDGELVRDLVGGHGRKFLWGIAKWCTIGSLASYTNSMIKFLQSKISIAFRTRLTRYIHDLYLNDNLNFYKLSNLDGGIGQGADQFITQDLTLFCDSAASLYSSLGKPAVDLVVFTWQLYHSLGPLALTGLWSNYFLTATLLRRLSPPFGKLKAVEGKREGDFRALHARLIANAEEVAFYGGDQMEKVFLDKGFRELKSLMESIYSLKIRYNMLEDFVLKYSWSAFGYLITSLPVFLPAWGGLASSSESGSSGGAAQSEEALMATSSKDSSGSRMRQFITNKRLMLSLADAGGRMMYSIKDLSELAGYTSRVYTLISTLHRVHANAYFAPRNTYPELYSLADTQGTVQKGFDGIRLEDVPVVAPNLYPQGGEELIPSLSMSIAKNDHLLIIGPNGAGKSAVARILAGLWPTYRGLVSRPRKSGLDGIIFLPQRPYLSPGTLRDQVIYPHTELDMRDSGRSDADLQLILDEARLGYIPEREGGWDTRKEWKDVLSGGEKQRMGFARMLYHEPRYAVLDEATSACSADVEPVLYEGAKARGITLITISTRASLKRYHTFTLTLGLGPAGDEWEFQRIGTESEKGSVEKELAELRARLAEKETWESRKKEIEAELAKVWTEGGKELEAPGYLGGAEGRNVKI
ncbi:ABC transporter transmembrane region 2-domain-containing protein [Elsinoe ampelina]|uniref:ABC transporter transmembrane region 2-domain-containing protein n=1 Tax=Elsinoe ampelina TaxID=302913 RepID=A0A6A6G241_9PEZI|nr:ABC transporter transmembrane region 2-domain-containing protein [Elsinoe ampelina]